MSDIFQEIKNQITCIQYAKQLGWDINKSGDRTYSLDKGSNKTCLVINDDCWYDYKTLKGGDVIDLSAQVNHGGDKAGALKELKFLLNISSNTQEYEIWKDYTQNLCNTIQKWHKQLEQEHYTYLQDRKITEETINKLKIGYNKGRIIVPYFKNSYVAYWIGRAYNNQDPKYFKPKKDGLNENIIWGLNTLDINKPLVITEGVFDAISAYQEGYSVLSSMGGHFSKAQLKNLIQICKNHDDIIICFDADEAGQSFNLKLASIFLSNRIKFNVAIPEHAKDINEYYIKNSHLNFMQNKIDGIQYICEKTQDQAEFKKVIKKIGRFISKTDLVLIFEKVKEKYPKAWLNELKKQALSPPTEYYITEEIKNKYNIKYHPQLGFYEYQDGYWQKKEKEEIKSKIKKELGYYSTSNKVNAITNLLSIETVTTKIFNQEPVINFKNGLLLIETGEFIKHDPSYNTSIQLDYNYIPSLYSDKWQKFLQDITMNDTQKINLIQEMFGYVLFNDCSLQKCFILMGEGSDGKSKLLDILSYMCGLENITAIEMSCLSEPFQRISLINSMVNISSETNTEVNQASQIFKQIVTGDYINACYKGLDFVTFKSRAKMIMASNNYLRSNDISHGLDRRIIFIKFPVKFCEKPIFDNEKEADPYITEKILPELPAIFNWAYDGYRRLLKEKKFTSINDEEEVREEFRELNNPIYVFINELELNAFESEQDFIETKVLYDKYKDWCRDVGRKQKSYTKFSRDFKSTAYSYFRDRLEFKRTENTRGYVLKEIF